MINKRNFLKFLIAMLSVIPLAACNDEPGGGDNGDGDEIEDDDTNNVGISEVILGYVFRNGFVTNYDGNELTITNGFVTGIHGNMGSATLSYSYNIPLAITMRAKMDGSAEVVYTMTCNGRGFPWFVTHVERTDPTDRNATRVYDIEYDDNDHMTKFIQRFNGGDETSVLTWENGNVTQVTTTWPGGRSVCDIQYYTELNKAGLMLYDSQLWVDTDDWGDVLYFCGLLGRPTRNLVSGMTATEQEGGSTYRFSSSSNYIMDFRDRPTQVRITETESGEGTYNNIIDITWTDHI